MPDPKSPPNDNVEAEDKARLEAELDQQLEDSFPASDPLKVTRVPASARITSDENA